MSRMLDDLKYPFRSLHKNPIFTITALATLILGAGIGLAVFSVYNTILLKPFNTSDSQRLARVFLRSETGISATLSFPQFVFLNENVKSVDAIAVCRLDFLNLASVAAPGLIPIARVTASLFKIFQPRLGIGRAFTTAEDLPGSGNFAVLGHQIWSQRFINLRLESLINLIQIPRIADGG